MNQAAKRTIIGLGVAGAIILGALLALKLLLDPNRFKQTLVEYVEHTTHHPTTINGPLKWSLFPWPSIEINEVELKNIPAFSQDTPLLTIKKLTCGLTLLPLLHGQIDIKKLTLTHPSIHLITDTKGKNNWALSPNAVFPAKKNPVKGQTQKQNQANASSQFKVRIDKVEIKDGFVEWKKLAQQRTLQIQSINLKTAHLLTPKRAIIKLDGLLTHPEAAWSSQFSLSTKANLDIQQQHYQFSRARLTTDLIPKKPSLRATVNLSADADIQMQNETFSIQNIQLRSNNLQAKGSIEGSQLLTSPQLKGTFTIGRFNPKQWLERFGITIEFPHHYSLNQLTLKSDLTFKESTWKLNSMQAQLDNTHVTGSIGYKTGDSPDISFNVSADQVALDDYIPMSLTSTHHTKDNKSKENNKTESSYHSPLTVRGHLRIKQLKLPSGTFQQLSTQVNYKNNQLKLNGLSAKAYQGQLKGNMTIDKKQSSPRYAFDGSLTQIPISKFIPTRQLTGQLSLYGNLSTTGNTHAAMTRQLNGRLRFKLTNGTLKGIDIIQQLNRAQEYIRTKRIPSQNRLGVTVFNNTQGLLIIRNGIVSNPALNLHGNQYAVKGSGTVNLNNRRINYRVHVHSQDKNFQGILGGHAIPLIITGTLDKPKVTPNFSEIGTMFIKSTIKSTIQKGVVKELEGADKILDTIFGR